VSRHDRPHRGCTHQEPRAPSRNRKSFRSCESRDRSPIRGSMRKLPRLLLRSLASLIAQVRARSGISLRRKISLYPMRGDAKLLRSKLVEFSAKGKFEETVVSLAVIGELAINAVDKLKTNKDDGGILLLCKGIGLNWSTTHAVLSLFLHRDRLADENETRARFERLTVATARRVLRFWQVRTSAVAPAKG
jgi:hypothetical protein